MLSVIFMKISRIYCPTATSLTSHFFFRYPDRQPFFNQTVHDRVLALSILMEIDKLIIVFIWLFVKGKDFSTRCLFPRENWWKIKDFMLFFHIFFANFWKFIETQGFLIGKIGRICKEMMIFEFFVVFYPGGGYLVERWVRGCAAQIGSQPHRFTNGPFFIWKLVEI